MLTDAIKQQILSLAIQGKLTDQRPEDGTAEELYRSILAEKKRFIKAGKMKKEKPLPPIEEEEIPFDIPKNWKWVRFGEIINIINGDRGKNYPAKSKLRDEGKIPFISALNIENNTISQKELLYLSEGQYKNLSSGKLQQRDIVLCIRGSLGKCGVFPYNQGAIASSLVIIRRILECNLTYLLSYLQADLFHDMIRAYNNGTAQPNLSAGNLALFRFPLPPLPEQERIASKLEAIMTALQDLEAAQQRAQSIKRELRKSLLQEAIQGKLTDQRPEDGSAEELYRSILAEKKRLIKAGKLKKEKPLPPLEEKDIPFDIPENWKWVRLGEITTYAQSKEKIEPSDISPETWSLDLEDIEKDSGRILVRNLAKERKITGSKNIFHKGELLYSKLRPYLKKILIAPEDGVCTPELVNFSAYNGISHSYLVQFLRSPYVDNLVNGKTYGVKMPRTNTETMCNLPVPLPPPAEQERIVAKLEELLPLCD